MRIDSVNRDYYDYYSAYSQEDFTWKRETSYVEVNAAVLEKLLGFDFPKLDYSMQSWLEVRSCDLKIIFFCGRVYPLFHVKVDWNRCESFYSPEEFQEFATERLSGKKINSKGGRGFLKELKGRLALLKALSAKTWDHSTAPFDEHYAPIFALANTYKYKNQHQLTLIVNPYLSTYDFNKVVSCWAAYQELSMWMRAMAAPQETIPEISDADMLEAKGFDPKTSFRQSGPGKKRNRRKYKNGRSG